MKTFNEIIAPRGGTVSFRSSSRTGHRVEYGQALCRHRMRFAPRSNAAAVSPGSRAPCSEKILIANRGEIALRILRAAKELGIATVAVHSTADAEAMHVKLADESVCLGPPAARDSYLNIPSLLAACEITGAEAVHPGYGFLSENARFAEILEEHGIGFIGPKAEHIRTMGDKIEAKKTALALGIPCVPGSDGGVTTDEEGLSIARTIGFPVLVKAAAGGGGRGMKVAMTAEDLPNALATARSEAKAAFGDGAVYLEKYLTTPRHIEVQILGDGQGHAMHLGERDCSLQRRHQKVWEEGPSPALNDTERPAYRRICAAAMRKLGLFGRRHHRVPVRERRLLLHRDEHPHSGRASGDGDDHRHRPRATSRSRSPPGSPLSIAQDDIVLRGHAIECRINAEHPTTFRPSPGKITYYHPPGGLGVRVDSAVYAGYTIPPNYDSLVGKLIVHGRTRTEALMRLRRALDEFIIDGIDTTLPLFRTLVRNVDIQNGDYDIHWLETFLAQHAHEIRTTP